MTTRRRYTKQEKADAVGAALASNATAAAERLGIPENTLRGWLDRPEYVELRSKTRDEVADRIWAAIQVGIEEVAKGLVGDAPLRDKATAVGILYDKHALLTGGATGRTESRDLTGTLSDEDIAKAVRYADDLTRAGAAGASDEAAESAEG